MLGKVTGFQQLLRNVMVLSVTLNLVVLPAQEWNRNWGKRMKMGKGYS